MRDDLMDIQSRLAFHEDALDGVARRLAAQEREIDDLRRRLEAVSALLSELTPSAVGDRDAEPPPPHY
jgi:SlyX protein